MSKAFLCLLGVLFVWNLAGQGNSLDRAWQLVGGGRYGEAVTTLRQLIEKDPHNAGARLLLGSILTEQRQPDAVVQLKEAVRLLPKSAEAENALGEAYLALADPTSALPEFEKAVALEPANGIAQLNLGRLLLEKGQSSAAEKHLAPAVASLKQTDEAAEAQYLLAQISSSQDNPASAAAHLQRAVALNPRLAPAWSDLGAALQLQQDDANALKAYARAVNLDPSDPVARYRFGSELLRENHPHEATVQLEAAYRLNPQDQSTLNALQTALRRDGRAAEADEIRRKLADLLQSRDQANQKALEAVKLNNEGAAFEKAGNLEEAAKRYKEGLALNPDQNGIRVNYAIALLRQGQWTEGLNQLHEASKRDPNDSKIQAALKDALSQAPPGSVPHWGDSPN